MRKNAPQERRLVYTAIEGITNTPTARKYGKGATAVEIMQYTGYGRIITDAAFKFLIQNGLINNRGNMLHEWFIKSAPPDNLCWAHGIQKTFGGKCIKCFKEEGR